VTVSDPVVRAGMQRDAEPGAFRDVRRQHDRETGLTQVKIAPGEYYVTAAIDEALVTILGSCVAVCMRDPVIGVGGMNHFLLAESDSGDWGGGKGAATRYGNHAMGALISAISALGGVRSRLEAKVFGGGHVLDARTAIGQENVEFAERYLEKEGISIAAKHVGGSHPRRIHYFPRSGKVQMLQLRRATDVAVFKAEMEFKRRAGIKPVDGAVED